MTPTGNAIALIVLVAGQAASGPSSPDQQRPKAGELKLSKSMVSLINQVQLPARQAGVLKELSLEDGTVVQEGLIIKKGQLLGMLDGEDALARQRAAESEHRVALAERDKAVASIKASAATIAVARAEVAVSRKIREGAKAGVTDQELRRQELTVTRAESEHEVATKEAETAGLTIEAKQAQLDVTAITVRHHRIESPLDGVIVQMFRRPGEWVSPGDPIMRVVYMDKLRVEGYVDADKFTPDEIHGREVEVAVHMPNNRTERFQGVIGFVSPTVEASREFRVWCEVANRAHKGHWVLRPGMIAEMSIRLNSVPAKVATNP